MKDAPLHILHIEDNATDLDLFQRACQKSGVPVKFTTAPDGAHGWELLSNALKSENPKLPDLVLLDLNLPNKDGRQLLKELKKHIRLRLIPVIILSASNAPDDVKTCYGEGAACYLLRPPDFHELVVLVSKLLGFWQIAELPRTSPQENIL